MPSPKVTCPGCGKPKTARAKVCARCRRRATAIGVRALIDSRKKGKTPEGEEKLNPKQRAGIYARCDEIDMYVDGVKTGNTKKRILEEAEREFGRPITSVNDLTYSEASWALDYLREEGYAAHLARTG